MSKDIRVTIIPREGVIASLIRDAGSFTFIGGLFWLNHNHLGDHWFVYLLSGFVGVVFMCGMARRHLPVTGVFRDPAEAIAFIERQAENAA